MAVQLSDDVSWIDECVELGPSAAPRSHKHVAVYVVHADRPVLVDSGSFLHRDAIVAGVEEATDDPVGTLILSHSDYPHAANVDAFAGPAGSADLVASSGAPAMQGLPEARQCEIGGTMSIEGHEFSFIDPPLADRSHSTWIFHHESGTLFTADGFGSRHRPGQCSATSEALDAGVPADAIEAFHRANLPWLPYVDPERLEAALDAVFSDYPIQWVAPIHGHPIAKAALPVFVNRLVEAAERIVAERIAGDPMDR